MSGPGFAYVVQVAVGIYDEDNRWSWDLNDVYSALSDAETARSEFYYEDKTTRIVKMSLVEVEVIQTFELPEEVPAGSLF